MLILRSPLTTRELGKPEDWDNEAHGECETLPIVDVNFAGVQAMISFWKPTPKELEMLMSNGHIELFIYGEIHPVVSVAVNDIRE